MTIRIPSIVTARGTGVMLTPQQALADGASAEDVSAAVDAVVIAEAHAAIREIARRAFTADAVQAAIYEAKFAEAQAFIAAGRPKDAAAAAYPFLTAEAPKRGLTRSALADLVVTTGTLWRTLAGAIEAARAEVRSVVAAGTDVDAKRAAARALVDGLAAQAAQVG
jgi:long-subunit fatty acid transport protein